MEGALYYRRGSVSIVNGFSWERFRVVRDIPSLKEMCYEVFFSLLYVLVGTLWRKQFGVSHRRGTPSHEALSVQMGRNITVLI